MCKDGIKAVLPGECSKGVGSKTREGKWPRAVSGGAPASDWSHKSDLSCKSQLLVCRSPSLAANCFEVTGEPGHFRLCVDKATAAAQGLAF